MAFDGIRPSVVGRQDERQVVVEPLHELTEQRRFRRPARAAIDSIQSRLGDVESGRLSLAPTIDPEGALSLAGAPEKAGGLSLDDEQNDPR